MPPLVDPGIVPAATSSASMEHNMISRSKSADDLMRLKRLATGQETRRRSSKQPIPKSNEQETVEDSLTTSLEKFGSYFFESFSRKEQRIPGHNHGSEDDLVLMRGKNGEGDDDASTTSTVVHFDNSDFLPSNWTGAVEYIPPVGMAVVAGGLFVMAPIVFVGGILTACTALGAVHAAQTSYEACVEGNLCQIFENDKKQGDKMEGSNPAELKREVSEVTFNLTGMEDVTSEVDPEVLKSPELLASTSFQRKIPQDPSMLESSEQALEWVNTYYPPLAYKNASNLEFKGLNALEYFDVFLTDDAPYTFEEFQKKRQDKNIRYGKWEDLTGVTQPSLVTAAETIKTPKNDDEPMYHNHLKERVLQFEAKTNSGLFGPPYATTTKVQRCLVANKRLIVLESKTTLKNIPFCDRFYVLERWLITSEKKDDQYVSLMTVSCQVVFTKSCTFESTIMSKSQDTVTDIATKWNEMAQKALERTEQARKERLQHDVLAKPPRPAPARVVPLKPPSTERMPNNGDCHETPEMDSSIEVESLSRSSSHVMGDAEPIVLEIDDEDERRTPLSGRRKSSLRRSLSGLLKRRQSNPL